MTAKGGIRETVRGAFFDNVGLKLLSILCALGIYAFIHGAENAERTLSVSIVTIMPPESANRQVMTQIPTEVKVTVRGSRTQLDDLRSDDLGTLNLNLRSGRESNIDLDPSMFRTPAGVSVAEINPPSIEIRWDDVVNHTIPIQISRTGEPAPSFAVKGVIRSEPANVAARGPRSVIDNIQYARSSPFDVTGLTEGVYRRPLPLDKPPRLVTYDVDSVMATVEIARELSKKEFANLRVEVVRNKRLIEGVKQSDEILDRLWALATEVGRENPQSPIVALFVQSLNETTDLHSKRIHYGFRSRIPGAIWWSLCAVAIASLITLGYHGALVARRRPIALFAVMVAFASIMGLIADLDRPLEGLLQVSQQSMIDLQSAMHATS